MTNLIHHIRITVSDRVRSQQFWSPVLDFLGYSLIDDNEDRVCYLAERDRAVFRFLICQAPAEFHDEQYELGRLGWHHLAFGAETPQQVDDFYRLLIDLGAPTQGPPAFYDYAPGYYAVYFRDPDNLKFELAYAPV